MERLLYDRKAAAQQLSLSVRTIDRFLAQGAFKFRRVGRKVLIPHSELVRFAKADHFAPLQPLTDGTSRSDLSE